MPEISWDTTRLMMLMITKTMMMGDDNDDEFDVRKFHGNAAGLSDAYNWWWGRICIRFYGVRKKMKKLVVTTIILMILIIW